MGRGYPDFFGFSIYPFYGVLLDEAIDLTPQILGDRTSLVVITGKGLITALALYCYFDVAGSNPEVDLYVDGDLIFGMNLSGMQQQGFSGGANHLMDLGFYDPDFNYSIVNLSKEVPFGQSFEVKGRDAEALGVKFSGHLWYYHYI